MTSRRAFAKAALAGALLRPVAGSRAEIAYPPVLPRPLAFPRDHGSHPDFRTEWWYITGWLRDATGGASAQAGELGVQVTFFRHRPGIAEGGTSRFAPKQLLFAHAAVADPALGALRHDQRAAREGFGIAQASEDDTDVILGDWSLRREGETYVARVAARDFAFVLAFAPRAPLLLQGDAGVSPKGRPEGEQVPQRVSAKGSPVSPKGRPEGEQAPERVSAKGSPASPKGRPEGEQVPERVSAEGSAVSRKGPRPAQASHYYSRPQLAATGTLTMGSVTRAVAGTAWLDHEWSSEYLAAEAQGWDWTGINFDDGGALMAFVIRDRAGGIYWAGGTWRDATGRVTTLHQDSVRFVPQRTWRSPRTGVAYPVAMRVVAGDVALDLVPLFDDQELDSRASVGTIYWEGAVRAVRDGKAVGRGYLELTGYGGPLRI